MFGVGWVEVLIVGLLIWLTLLSYFFWRTSGFLRKLFPKSARESSDAAILIREQFESLLSSVEDVSKRGRVLRKGLKEISLESLNHIQRIEISRYNPFEDTGGNQSFSIVFLDGKQNGLILSSLHSRAGTRIYVKPVNEGKSELELSKEEKELLRKVLG